MIWRCRFEDVEKIQMEFESKLGSVRIGCNKSDKQLNEIESITRFHKSREEFNNFYNDYFKMEHKAYDSKLGKGFKIWSPKQMMQRLPIALAEVKAGDTSENLLNEIRQITYSLWHVREVTKKVYNIIMNWIKV